MLYIYTVLIVKITMIKLVYLFISVVTLCSLHLVTLYRNLLRFSFPFLLFRCVCLQSQRNYQEHELTRAVRATTTTTVTTTTTATTSTKKYRQMDLSDKKIKTATSKATVTTTKIATTSTKSIDKWI